MGLPTMRICVTEDDIKSGRPRSSRCCPIALSLKRLGLGLENSIAVGRYYVEVGAGTLLPLPPTATRFIRDFDTGKQVAPFEFEFELEFEVGGSRARVRRLIEDIWLLRSNLTHNESIFLEDLWDWAYRGEVSLEQEERLREIAKREGVG